MGLEGFNIDKFLLYKYYIFIVEKLDNINKLKVNYEEERNIYNLFFRDKIFNFFFILFFDNDFNIFFI